MKDFSSKPISRHENDIKGLPFRDIKCLIMSPTEVEGDILFLVWVLLASVLALASAWHVLVCRVSHEPLGGF